MNKYPYEYSQKEIQLIETMKAEHFAMSPSLVPYLVYREMAIQCFRDKRNDFVSESIHRCLIAQEMSKPSRLTPEFDALIVLDKVDGDLHSGEFFVDFDGTICPNKDCWTEYPPPTQECKLTLQLLRDQGYKIIIYSVRSNMSVTTKVNGHTKMLAYLEEHGIKYDGIYSSKPHMKRFIDDKAIGEVDQSGNVDWSRVLVHLLDRKLMMTENVRKVIESPGYVDEDKRITEKAIGLSTRYLQRKLDA